MHSLYQVDTVSHTPEQALAQMLEVRPLSPASADFARHLVEGVISQTKELDAIIARFATAFPVAQLPAIDHNILRLAIFEIMFDNKVPEKVAINEAVDLAKIYGSEASSRFINGVLGSIIKQKEVNGCPPSAKG